ncbi:NADPH:adrenodoxin oxidoreductase, mitochondrial [Aphelenchoides bicaudatus]|nr:NADPH:adrenodoxin oxidoreductase, mitochondrial [Aphelenchoides bicaudatus]
MLIARQFLNGTRAAHSAAGPRIAVIGSGPAGLYSCSALLNRLPECRLDVVDRSPVPYGLVQFGVAPDHAEMKKCANSFERMFDRHQDRLSLFCNVAVGETVHYEDLCQLYDVVILAYGASRARKLEIPNVKSKYNCFSGSSFVSWYNGQPKKELLPNLNSQHAIIIGNGNVSIDCARILLSDSERFRYTDIPDYAYKSLTQSKIQTVNILGRRGPIEASFTIKELRELLNLDGAPVHCDIDQSVYDQVLLHIKNPDLPRKNRRILELMLNKRQAQPRSSSSKRYGSVIFHRKPEEVLLNSSKTKIEALITRNLLNNEIIEMPCDLLIYAIGFINSHLPGVPVNEEQKLRLLDWCRVDESRTKVYATGWCAQAGSGVIADTQRNASLVADEVLNDWKEGRIKSKSEGKDIRQLLQQRGTRFVSWTDWKLIDQAERELGAKLGKPREKINDVLGYLSSSDERRAQSTE